jgi:hypothetical protein
MQTTTPFTQAEARGEEMMTKKERIQAVLRAYEVACYNAKLPYWMLLGCQRTATLDAAAVKAWKTALEAIEKAKAVRDAALAAIEKEATDATS